MCRWLTGCGALIYLDKVLFEPQNSLINQSLHARHSHVTTNGDGFGVGWYGERGVPGVYRDIPPAWNDHNLKSLSHQIRSGLFLAHVRAPRPARRRRAPIAIPSRMASGCSCTTARSAAMNACAASWNR